MDPTRNFTPQSQRLYNPTTSPSPAVATMRTTPARPRSRGHVPQRAQETEPVAKKIFNCIVDDTALVQGAKKSTRDGIPKWIAAGQIRLFVPLYTLSQTSRVKERKGRIATDSEEALLWLDDATTSAPHLVTLQGGFEKFETWKEVEQFALPKTLFSEEDVLEDAEDVDDLPEQTELKLSLAEETQPRQSLSSNESVEATSEPASDASVRSSSPISPPTSPIKQNGAVNSPLTKHQASNGITTANKSTTSTKNTTDIPTALQPLFNYILWRIHQEIDPVAALESFIFLCDDPSKRKYAQRFGIRTKSLSDIRYAIAREGQESRNRQIVQKKEAAKTLGTATTQHTPNTSIKTPPSIFGSPQLANALPVKASDSVSANGHEDSDDEEIVLKRPPKAPAAMLAVQPPQGGRGKVLDPNQFRRNVSGPTRASPRGASRGGAPRGSTRGNINGRGPTKQENNGPIDPDSFTRPASGRGGHRGGRRLWLPG